jgi:pilus assembly protein CpaB
MGISNLRNVLQSNILLAAMALATGVLAAWLGARHLNTRAATLEQDVRQRYAASPFIVATRDLAKGQRVEASALSIRSMPRAFAPADALSPESAGMLIGGRTAIAIRRGTPVVQSALLSEQSRERLSEQLPDGMRALTIQVDQLNAISGHLEAGDAVDLFYSRPRGSGAVLVPLMERVRVLATGDITEAQAVDQSAGQLADGFTTVTLLLSAADSHRVVLAEQTGRLTLVLRRSSDQGSLEARSFDSSELLKAAHAGKSHAPGTFRTVELLIGGNGGSPARSWLSPGEGT